ncbi:hypothetical protein MPTK1_1g11090 [Marchantia polymorpha subsp. ruderalis]|uniref:Uncharacterized protein n=2 Tax=Marchantia polymorpha TaxID=3197 RepID=A0AAF6ANW4_MARPO|nr:hypothetical protein MARPO_0014s0116 [Marchantia polymorpha]BBM98134.1 hypothetical protein Mp_1g11090 [Marchantia polymorpha subsp. ruderalis]|eukprot:PTQ45589.1 hypothetical protein MARPO_0014s0116 [Marchantia polymorpha]
MAIRKSLLCSGPFFYRTNGRKKAALRPPPPDTFVTVVGVGRTRTSSLDIVGHSHWPNRSTRTFNVVASSRRLGARSK